MGNRLSDNRRDAIGFWFAIAFVAIPALVHALFEGQYVVNSDGRPVTYEFVERFNSPAKGAYVANPDVGRRTFWIGPVSSTLPFVFLALLFLAHCGRIKSKSRRSAFCGSVAAWLGMMAFTIFVISHPPSPHLSSTIGIAAALTPFCYIPFLFSSYVVGAIVGAFWSRCEDR